MDRDKLKGYGLMFLSSSLMGGIGAFARYIEAPGLFISFCRNFAGLLGMIAIWLVTKRFVKLRSLRMSSTILLSGVFLGLLSGLYVVATQMTTLANAAFLIYTGPVYSTVLASIFLKEPFTKATAAALGAVFLGALLIIGIINYGETGGLTLTLDLDPKYMLGNLIALGSGVAYGLYLFFSRYRDDVDSDTRAFTNFLFASLTLLVLVIGGGTDLSEMTTRGWIVLVVAALITGFGAFYCLTLATRLLLAGELATISYQETIMATLLGVLLFSEPLTVLQMIGGALIVIGGVGQIIYSTRVAGRRAVAPAPQPAQV